ncbi:interleukin-23 subunit alpha [Corvus moneduloides]|uniref:interleukin-23 subunit alpha n=1 Tax=Corvus moneduloides TaxID=1196302 RepID=UPI00136204D2|nr:interleukin-23 subunit alpha [Corvus moneduloides]
MAPLRRLLLCLCLALLLPPPAAPAPTPAPGRRPDWAACRILSRELSRLLATVKEPHSALEGMQLMEEDPQNWPPRIRCSDSCDPLTLESNNTRCLHRIRQALQHYRDLLGSDIFREQPQPQLETTMEQLLRHVHEGPGRPPRPPPPAPTKVWAHPFQRHLALKRLRSFAAVIGRVFNHSAR